MTLFACLPLIDTYGSKCAYQRLVLEGGSVLAHGSGEPLASSLSENCQGCCGEGFWLWPRRRGRRIPAAGCNDRANAGQRQKTHRPEGFRAEGRLASLLLSRRPTRGMGFPSPASQIPKTEGCAIAHSSLLRRASPSGLLRENSTPWNFQTGSKARAFPAAKRAAQSTWRLQKSK